MAMIWYWVGAAIGIYMVWGAATKSAVGPYRLLHARAALLWKNKAHEFLLVSGAVVVVIMLGLALLN